MATRDRTAGRPPSFDESAALSAAVVVIDRVGVDKCTLRAVGEQLGVTAMALYRYFPSKSDLLDRVPDHLVEGIHEGLDEAGDGIDCLRRLAQQIEQILVAHPKAVSLFTRPAMGSNMASAAQVALAALQLDGYSEERASGLLRATMSLVVGLASGGGSSADAHLGPVAEDALEVWLTGVQASSRQTG